MSAARHDTFTALLHWLQAALILTLLVIGWTMVDLPKGPDKAALFALHKSLGLCALALLALRFAWRLHHRVPPAGTSALDQLGLTSQRLLYLLLALTPIFGALSTLFGKHPLRFFAWQITKPLAADDRLNQLFVALHLASGLALAALITLHVGAAAYHRLRRDGVLHRMPPFPKHY